MREVRILVAVGGLLVLGACAAEQANNAVLSQYPGIQQQIITYYDDNATEDDWTCTEVEMLAIARIQVARQDADTISFAVNYDFQPEDGITMSGPGCQGFSTRIFIFGKGSGGGELSLQSMSGPQRKPAAS